MKRIFFSLVLLMFFTGTGFTQNWTYANSTGTTYILYGMSFPPNQNNVGYACGMQYTYNAPGVIIKTTDGGDNWVKIWPASGTIDGLQGIWFINDTVGFACGWNNYFIKTTDGGTTWNSVSVASGVWYYVDVEFRDANNGAAAAVMSNPGTTSIFITSDGGTTWVPASSGATTNNIKGISYASQNTLFAVTSDMQGQVLKSTDGGHNWTVVSTLPAMLLGVDFSDDNYGVVGGEEKMFTTTSGGVSWSTHTTGYENFYGTKAFSDGTGYVGGTDARIYLTPDFGSSWQLDFGGGNATLYRIRSTQNGALFACGSGGTILKKDPVLQANFEADDSTICVPGTVNFTDLSTGYVVSWNWTFEGGTPNTSTDQNPTVTYNTTGDFDVTLVVSDSANSDTLFVNDLIHVIDVPVAPGIPSGDTTVCGGSSVTYTTNSVQFADDYQWEIYPADAGIITGNDTIANVLTDDTWTGNYSVKVKAHSECGWSDWSDSLMCTLNFSPTAFELSEGGSYCSGGAGIEILLYGSELNVNYALYRNDDSTGIVVPGDGDTISFGYQTQMGTYTAVGFAAFCSEDMIGSPSVMIDFSPIAAEIPIGPDSVCRGTTTIYYENPVYGADTLLWTLIPDSAGSMTFSNDSLFITWDSAFIGMATLTVQGSNYCGQGEMSPPLDIEVFSLPEPEVSGDSLVCNDHDNDYTTAYNEGSTYLWDVSGGDVVSGAGTNTVTVHWNNPGTGYVTVTETSAAGCSATSGQLMVNIDDCTGIDVLSEPMVTVYPNPAKNRVNMRFEGVTDDVAAIQITNMTGVTIVEKTFSITKRTKVTLNTTGMPEGSYLIRISLENSNPIYKKFSVKR